MPTRERLLARALGEATLDLQQAAERIGYAPETLRKMWWTAKPPPPLFKFRGRWRVKVSELDAWAADRDGREL